MILNINLYKIQLSSTSSHNSQLVDYSHFQGIWFVLDVFKTSDMENKNSRAWPSSSIIFPFLCAKHSPYNGLAQRKNHFLPEAAKILIKTQRSEQQLPRCMSSNGNTWRKQRRRSASCNSLTEGEERRRARGDRGFHKGQREWGRGKDRQGERWGEDMRFGEDRRRDCTDTESFREIRRREDQRSIIASHYPFCALTWGEDSLV